MAELVPSITITEFRKLKVHELKELKSCEVLSDGEYLFTFINANTDYIKIQAEYMAQMSNTVGGKELEDILNPLQVEEESLPVKKHRAKNAKRSSKLTYATL